MVYFLGNFFLRCPVLPIMLHLFYFLIFSSLFLIFGVTGLFVKSGCPLLDCLVSDICYIDKIRAFSCKYLNQGCIQSSCNFFLEKYSKCLWNWWLGFLFKSIRIYVCFSASSLVRRTPAVHLLACAPVETAYGIC